MDTNNTKDNRRGGSQQRSNHSNNVTTEKKPFDKKKYRLQKYSNKYKVDQWDERRKKAALRGFYKDLQKDQRNTPSKAPLLETGDDKTEDKSSDKRKKSPFFAAKQEFKKRKAEKQAKKDQSLKSKEERKEALKNYKEKKMLMYKKLSKKTKTGQPVMKERLEMLLEKIKESTGAD